MSGVEPKKLLWRILKRLLWLAAGLVLLAAVGAVLAPMLLPESAVRQQMESMLAERMGLPVTVESARFSWIDGLHLGGLRIARSALAPDALLAKADRLAVRVSPLELLRNWGGDVPLQVVRAEGLEAWIVVDPSGRLNIEDLPQSDIQTVQVVGGTFHIENQALGRSVTLSNVNASIGKLATSGKGYVNLSADLPGAKPGRVLVTASLSSLDFSKRDRLAGSVKVEWNDASWRDLLYAVTADPNVRGIAGRTSGRLGASFERGNWSVEGALEATDLVVARMPDAQPVILPQAVVGLQLRQLGAGKPIEVSLAKFSAPGIDIRASGTVDLAAPAVPTPATATPVAAKKSPAAPAAGSGTAGSKAAIPAAPPALPLWPKALDLEATATLTWAPLCQNIAALKHVAEQFEQLGGGADARLHFTTKPEGFHITASADLSHTAVAWPQVIRKAAGQELRLEADATCSRDLARVDLAHLSLFTDAGRSEAGRPLPLLTAKGQLGKPAETHLDITATIGQVEMLLAMAPGAAAALAPISAQGPASAHVTCKPTETRDGPPALATTLHADLTATRLLLPDGVQKRPEVRCTVDASGAVAAEARQVNIGSVLIGLAGSTLDWDGAAKVEWQKGSPTGRFEGTLKVAGIESAGAILAPDRFSAASSPVAGEATIDGTGELSEGRVRGQMKANLDRLAVNVKDWFIKPLGQPASIAATGFWQAGRGDHYILAEADIGVPGGRFHALGRGTLLVKWAEAPEEEGKPGAPRWTLASVSAAPESTIELNASVSDMTRLMELSPAAKRYVAGSRIEGAAESSLVFTMRPRAGHVAGTIDLTGAALDLGDALRKPRAMPMRLDLVLDILPPQPGSVELYLTKAEARLGTSVTGASGHVKLSRPAPDANLTSGRQLIALLQEVDLEIHADWQHTAEMRQALPCMEALYTQADLDGLTQFSVSLAGTPLKGKVRASVDATACRILHGESILKPAGTAAAFDLEARYGESPGELVLDRFAVKLADSAVTVAGRMLFDNPNLGALAPPSSWTFRIDGKAPDATALAALFPSRLGDLRPSGGITFKIRASADPRGAELEACDLAFDKASITCLGKKMLLAGPISYDGERLAADGLNIVVGRSDITLTAYIQQPDRTPTGSILVRGKNLDVKELLDLIQEASKQVAAWAATAAPDTAPAAPPAAAATVKAQPAAPQPVSRQLARYGQRLLADAQFSAEIAMERVTVVIPEWNTTYELTGLAAEGRLAGRQFSVPRFKCSMNEGAISGEILLDFRSQPPVLSFLYDARDLKMADNLKPFIESTFPGMQVFGKVSQRVSTTQALAEGSFPKGRGETTLNNGMLRGPGAPDYITNVLPGLKLSEYPFRRMTDDFENKGNGDIDNRMIFEGKAYDVYIFGISHADGQVDYSLGIDLMVSLGSKVLTRMDQGKLPLMYYTGRIKGTAYAEGPFIRYVLPHEFAYDVFVRRNLLLQLVSKIGEKPPEIPMPPVMPSEKTRTKAGG